MASIEKRGTRYRVKWRNRDDGSRDGIACPDHATAKEIKREAERSIALTGRFDPRRVHKEPDLREMMQEYIRDFTDRDARRRGLLVPELDLRDEEQVGSERGRAGRQRER